MSLNCKQGAISEKLIPQKACLQGSQVTMVENLKQVVEGVLGIAGNSGDTTVMLNFPTDVHPSW